MVMPLLKSVGPESAWPSLNNHIQITVAIIDGFGSWTPINIILTTTGLDWGILDPPTIYTEHVYVHL